MNTFNLNLDLDKRGGVAQWVTLRQGDHNGTELRATIYDHGTQAGGGYTCRVSIRLPGAGDEYYRETATYTNGVAVVTVDEEYAAAIVGVTEGYFELLQGDAVIASTESFGVRILRSAQDGAVPGDKYDSAIEDALAELDEATGRISQMVVDATEEYLEAHPELTTTVEDNSLTDAKLIQSGGILDRVARLWHRLDNLLTATPAEAASLTVSDAAKTPLAGLALYGRSTQDGTPTPSSPVAIQSVTPNLAKGYAATATNNGITYVTTEGGATTISGTASGGSAMPLQTAGTFELPAGTYTLVMGGELTASGTGARAQLVKVTGSSISNVNATPYTTGGGTVYVTFTTTEDMTAFVRIGVNSGSVVSGTLQFALYEGGVAYPPTTCGGVGLWARGRNLLNPSQVFGGASYYTVNADGTLTVTAEDSRGWTSLPVAPLGAGTFTLSIDGNADGRVTFRAIDGSSETSRGINGNGSDTFTLTSGGGLRIKVHQGTFPRTVRIQVNAGSTATAYVSYAESVTPIDLQGHELRSLPDGTRDEVTVDQYGHVTLVQRVGSVDLGTLTWTTISSAETPYFNAVPPTDIYTGYTIQSTNFRCSAYEHAAIGSTGDVNGMCIASNRGGIRTRDSRYTNTTAFKPAVSGTELIYQLATPVTIDLGTIAPIALQGPDMTAQAVPTAPFALTYERDLNVTLARLEASIAELATN